MNIAHRHALRQPCAASRDLNRHLAELDRLDARRDAIENQAAEISDDPAALNSALHEFCDTREITGTWLDWTEYAENKTGRLNLGFSENDLLYLGAAKQYSRLFDLILFRLPDETGNRYSKLLGALQQLAAYREAEKQIDRQAREI